MTANQPGSGRRILFGLLFLVSVFPMLTACSEPADQKPAALEDSSAPGAEITITDTGPSEGLSAERMAQWTRNCALCHVRGEGGAPVLGDRDAWKSRWEQGEAVLLTHTVEGLNNMPPLGYCMDCEEADFVALIRFMGAER